MGKHPIFKNSGKFNSIDCTWIKTMLYTSFSFLDEDKAILPLLSL